MVAHSATDKSDELKMNVSASEPHSVTFTNNVKPYTTYVVFVYAKDSQHEVTSAPSAAVGFHTQGISKF